MFKFLKKIKCKIFICCKSKCSMNDDNYHDRYNSNYITKRIVMTTDV